MVKYNFEWEKRKLADHKRSYKSHRQRYEAGDLERGWQPKSTFYKFNTFEEYQEDLENKIRRLLDVRAETVSPQVNEAQVQIYGTGDYSSRAVYRGSSKDGAVIFIGFHLDTISNSLYSPDGNSHEEDLKDIGEHEFRHHNDRLMLANARNLKNIAYGISNKIKTEYLTKVRTEGFAEFYPTNPNFIIKELMSGECNEDLRKITSSVDNVIDFLDKGAPIPRREGNITYPGNVYSWKYELMKLQERSGFCPYDQGREIFGIIMKAEKEAILRSDMSKMNSLVIAPRAFYDEVSARILAMKSFGDFYDYYKRCASSIGLSENEMIIRPRHAEYIKEEEKLDLVAKVGRIVLQSSQ